MNWLIINQSPDSNLNPLPLPNPHPPTSNNHLPTYSRSHPRHPIPPHLRSRSTQNPPITPRSISHLQQRSRILNLPTPANPHPPLLHSDRTYLLPHGVIESIHYFPTPETCRRERRVQSRSRRWRWMVLSHPSPCTTHKRGWRRREKRKGGASNSRYPPRIPRTFLSALHTRKPSENLASTGIISIVRQCGRGHIESVEGLAC